ncbi:MAG: GDSL-type esterase/lipase family protein [Actinomycetia bacterium]|nr:GDSL-type esterase/lipase family protein [Actinomycetes bacterium]
MSFTVSADPQSPGSVRDVCVVTLGGALACGVGDPRSQGFVTRVMARTTAEDLRLTAYGLAVVGDTSADVLRRSQSEALERWAGHDDRRLLLSVGLEEVRSGISIARHRLNLANVLDNAVNDGIASFVVGPAPTGDDETDDALARYAEAQADVCDRRAVPFVDCLTPLRRHDQWLTDVETGGGLPGQAGYGLIAWLVLNHGWRSFMGVTG